MAQGASAASPGVVHELERSTKKAAHRDFNLDPVQALANPQFEVGIADFDTLIWPLDAVKPAEIYLLLPT